MPRITVGIFSLRIWGNMLIKMPTGYTRSLFYKQQEISNESLDYEKAKQRESRFEMKIAKISNKKSCFLCKSEFLSKKMNKIG